MRVYGLCCCLY